MKELDIMSIICYTVFRFEDETEERHEMAEMQTVERIVVSDGWAVTIIQGTTEAGEQSYGYICPETGYTVFGTYDEDTNRVTPYGGDIEAARTAARAARQSMADRSRHEAEMAAARAAKRAARTSVRTVLCDCGHRVPASLVMSASSGTSCPDCYDEMSD